MGGLALAFAACVGVPCVVFYLHLRHWLFVGLALWPPVAVATSVALLGPSDFDHAMIAALFGTITALTLASQTFQGISAGRTPRKAASDASWFAAISLGVVLAAYLIFLCISAAIFGDWRGCAVMAVLFATGFGAAFVGNLASAFFPYSEQAIAEANAAREWRERISDRYFPEMQTRWAFSVTGTAMVLGAIAVFGIRDAHAYWPAQSMFSPPMALLAAVAGFGFVAREWRVATALTLTALFNAALLSWAAVHRDRYPDLTSVGAMVALSSAPLIVLAARARQYMREGDETASALATSVREEGALAVALGLTTGIPGFFSTITSAALSPALVFAVSSMFAALLLFPALTVAIYALIPRYRTVDEVFGRR